MNSNIFKNNLDFLLKENRITKCELEKDAGVSAGSINRSVKDSEMFSPALKVANELANKSGVSLDSLFNVDYSELDPAEKHVVNYINKLQKDTVAWINERHSARPSKESVIKDWYQNVMGVNNG